MKKMSLIDIIAYPICYAYGEIWHTPKQAVSKELAEKIRKQGVVHFGKSQHIDSILEDGMLSKYAKPLCPQEEGMSWFYLNETDDLPEFWEIIQTKGERKNNDTIYYFEEITDEQIAQMLVRPSDGAIVFVGDFSTSKMYAEPIAEKLNKR